jgi:nicotinamide mononucleotide (NMN) deamidase PncC
VSAKIAEQMSLQISNVFLSDWGIAITGYAAPMPECSIEDLFAYYAITFRGKLLSSQKIEAETESPMKVQIFYVNHILREYNTLLLGV